MQPGDQIDRFEIVRLLGKGGIASVYQVRSRHLDTEHAIKMLAVHGPSMAQRLLQEGKIQARLRHPNVVSVTDVVEHDGQVGLVMEFVDGYSLRDCIDQEGAMHPDDALELFRQILDGVSAAHAHGVTHRDLKPDNVLLTSDGNRVVAKITDFGIAKMFENGGGEVLTRQGVAMGTPGYMAPEQIRDSKEVDHRADVFALGAILYEMLAGRRAFKGRDALTTMNQTVAGSYVPLADVADLSELGNLNERLVDAVRCSLEVDPADRFGSCDDFARAVFDDGPIPERPPLVTAEEPVFIVPEELQEGAPNPTLMPDDASTMFPDADPDPGPYPEEDEPTDPSVEMRLDEVPTLPDAQRQPADDAEEEIDTEPIPVHKKRDPDALVDVRLPPPRPVSHADSEDEAKKKKAKQAEPGLPGLRKDWMRRLILKINAFMAPIIYAFVQVLKYVWVPLTCMIVLAGYFGNRGAGEVETARESFEVRAKAADAAIEENIVVAGEMLEQVSNPDLIRTLQQRYNNAVTRDERIAVGTELYQQLELQLANLPAGDPETEAKRRELEIRINSVLRKQAELEKAQASLKQAETSVAGTVARRLGMTDDEG